MEQKSNLDLMRSFAVFLVVFDHLLLAMGYRQIGPPQMHLVVGWWGIFGVDLFFVHTALVLMWSLQRKPHTLDFYIRRVFRIYPLAVFAILLVVVFHLPLCPLNGQMFEQFHTTKLGMLSNFLLIQNMTHTSEYAIAVLWSLPIEVDMYVLLPVVYFFVRKNFSLWPLLLIWTVACGLMYVDTSIINGYAYNSVVPCFLPGVMAYVLFAQKKPRLPTWLFPCFLVLLTLTFLHYCSVVVSWPLSLVLGLSLPYFHQVRSAPLVRLFHEVAKYSYGIYLTHYFALGLTFRYLSLHSQGMQIAVTLSATAVFSIVGYHLVEHPLIRLGARLAAYAERTYQQHSPAETLHA